MVAPSFGTWSALWNWLSIPHHEGDLVKKLITYQQLTQVMAWSGGCSHLWHLVSLESKITLRFLVIGCIKILAWHWQNSLLYRDYIASALRVWSWFFSCISSFDLLGVNNKILSGIFLDDQGCPSRYLEEGEWSFEVRERSSTSGSQIWRSTCRIEALEREFEFSLFFSLSLMLCDLLFFWISIIYSWTCVTNHLSKGDGL
jgi:hypothetical protein